METRFNLVDLSDELWLYWIKDSSDKITGYSPESSYRCLDLWKFQCCDILFCWWIEYLLKVWENLQKVFAPTFPIRPLCQTYWLPSWEETTTIIIFRRIIQWNLSTFFTRNQEQDWIKWHHHASRNQNLKKIKLTQGVRIWYCLFEKFSLKEFKPLWNSPSVCKTVFVLDHIFSRRKKLSRKKNYHIFLTDSFLIFSTNGL